MILLLKMNSLRLVHKNSMLEPFVPWYSVSVLKIMFKIFFMYHCRDFVLFSLFIKELVSSLQNKIDESEIKYEEISKLSEERIKLEVPVIDQTAIIKLEAENQQLKVEFIDTDFNKQCKFIIVFPLNS